MPSSVKIRYFAVGLDQSLELDLYFCLSPTCHHLPSPQNWKQIFTRRYFKRCYSGYCQIVNQHVLTECLLILFQSTKACAVGDAEKFKVHLLNLRAYLIGRRKKKLPSVNDSLRTQRKECAEYLKILEKNGISRGLLGSNNHGKFSAVTTFRW